MMLKRLTTILLMSLLLTAHATEFRGLKQQVIGAEIHISPQFNVELSAKVRQAIENGIVITFVMQAKLNQSVNWWPDTTIESKIQTFQVRYFSLSSQYQLHNRNQKSKLSFADLDQLLTHLGSKTNFVFAAGSQADYVLTRIFLDKQALPSIMQLPNVFDADWNLNSDWQTSGLDNKAAADRP